MRKMARKTLCSSLSTVISVTESDYSEDVFSEPYQFRTRLDDEEMTKAAEQLRNLAATKRMN